MAYAAYKAKQFKLSGLDGISDQTLETHFGLYAGYVKNTNLLMEQISAITRKNCKRAIDQSFDGFENWQQAFTAVGEMRGVGWAILYQDPVTERLSNHWIALHQDGVPSGFKPILVMDVWEHAFLLDYKPAERGKYIDAFFKNVDWEAVHRRLATPAAVRAVA